MSAKVQRGDKILYIPHEGHWNDWADREPLFAFHYDHRDHPVYGARHGEPVDPHELHEARPVMRLNDAKQPELHLGDRKIRIRVGAPKRHWPGVVLGVHEDGTVDVLVQHPDPGQGTREYLNLRQVAADLEPKPLHTFYLAPKA